MKCGSAMTTVYDVPADIFIEETASELKSLPEILPPQWAPFVKTDVNRELHPDNLYWLYVRS